MATSAPQEMAHSVLVSSRRKRLRAEDLWDEEPTSWDEHGREPSSAESKRHCRSGDQSINSLDKGALFSPPTEEEVRDVANSRKSTQAVDDRHQASLSSSLVAQPIALQGAICRQQEDGLDDEDYALLLEDRRQGTPKGTDRYAPASHPGQDASQRSNAGLTVTPIGSPLPPQRMSNDLQGVTRAQQRFRKRGSRGRKRGRTRTPGLLDLPETALDRILSLLLVRDEPISLDHSWLIDSFVSHHTTVPATNRTVTIEDREHTILLSEASLRTSVDRLQEDMSAAYHQLLRHAAAQRPLRSPTRGLATATLHLCHSLHQRAARIFYSQNTFRFPSASSAWLTLEAFLITIGKANSAHLHHLCVHAPLWHTGIQHDAVQGAVLDALTEATRLAFWDEPPTDRLLFAITTFVEYIKESGALQSLEIILNYPDAARCWVGNLNSLRPMLISLADAQGHVERRAKGTIMLRQASELLGSSRRPVIKVHCKGQLTRNTATIFERVYLTAVRKEAEEYGWCVDQALHAHR